MKQQRDRSRRRNHVGDDEFVAVDVADGGRARQRIYDNIGDRADVRRGDPIPIVVDPNGSLRLGGRIGGRAEAIGRKAVRSLDRFLGKVARYSRQAPADERVDEWGIDDYEDQLRRERHAKRILSDALRKQVRRNVQLRAANVAYEISADDDRGRVDPRRGRVAGGDVDADYDADGDDEFFQHPSDEGGDDFGRGRGDRGRGRGDGVGRWHQQRPVAPRGWLRTPVADGIDVHTAPNREVAHMALGGGLHIVAEIPREVRERHAVGEIAGAIERAALRLLGAPSAPSSSAVVLAGTGAVGGGADGGVVVGGPWYREIRR